MTLQEHHHSQFRRNTRVDAGHTVQNLEVRPAIGRARNRGLRPSCEKNP